ncbi:MAG: PEP-CTERM sorting domain-containing protein [Planctomycetia bacterium]|nr:PEP-CTERM sorting domain-containing protein [Planctomycetia bacterium]
MAALRLHRLGAIALAVVLVGVATSASADAIPGLFNTGVDAGGNVLPDGSVDPHYTLISSDDPSFPGPNALVVNAPLPGTWVANSSTSKWISARSSLGVEQTLAAGTYIYRLSFDLTGFDFTQAAITGDWAVDDIGLILLNGTYVPFTTNVTGPGSLTSFSIPSTANFVAGVNHLDFAVINSAPGASGLRIEGLSGTVPGIPEPSTVVLAGLGFVGLIAFRARRKRSG